MPKENIMKENKRETLRNNLPPINVDNLNSFQEEGTEAIITPQILDTEKIITNCRQLQKRATADWVKIENMGNYCNIDRSQFGKGTSPLIKKS
mmetsp:Transcript_11367/g.10032  ORF Transcript_11367/g.10032 Transcript_11367/m.10032 type:complete len:93 (+) Transcript_11367:83-361(+)